jgi:AcrR family transcriptional regulator
VLREAARMVGVAPNATYRHFADRSELLAAVCAAAMGELAERMAAAVAAVHGAHGDPEGALLRLLALGTSYLDFAHQEPGLFATAYAVPEEHEYAAQEDGEAARKDRSPMALLRAALDELVAARLLSPQRREDIEYPVWSTVHGLAVLTGTGPLRDISDDTRQHLNDLTLAFIGESLN